MTEDVREEFKRRMRSALETLADPAASPDAQDAATAELEALREREKTLPFEIAAQQFGRDDSLRRPGPAGGVEA